MTVGDVIGDSRSLTSTGHFSCARTEKQERRVTAITTNVHQEPRTVTSGSVVVSTGLPCPFVGGPSGGASAGVSLKFLNLPAEPVCARRREWSKNQQIELMGATAYAQGSLPDRDRGEASTQKYGFVLPLRNCTVLTIIYIVRKWGADHEYRCDLDQQGTDDNS